jgi:hypothetical protein
VQIARHIISIHPEVMYIGWLMLQALIHVMIDRAGRPPLKPAKKGRTPDYVNRTDLWGVGILPKPE